jgi:DNA-binding NarL/FixJ family response regulator
MKSVINVVIVDDQEIIIQGLLKLFELHPQINVVCKAHDGIEVINWFKENKNKIKVDVILMDIQMPNMDGWEATEILVRKYKNLKIIGLSSYDNEAFIDRFIKSGGRGYLLKAQEFDEIVSAIEQVVEIGFYLTERVPLQKIQDYVNNKVLSPNFNTTNLSDQEIKIVQLICQEKTSLEIADLLCVSKKTIESHRDKILNKIKARNMVGIAIYAMKHKLIEFKD